MDAVQELRGRNGCNGDWLVTVVAKHTLKVELAALRRAPACSTDRTGATLPRDRGLFAYAMLDSRRYSSVSGPVSTSTEAWTAER